VEIALSLKTIVWLYGTDLQYLLVLEIHQFCRLTILETKAHKLFHH
jgi:hypothetical protein